MATGCRREPHIVAGSAETVGVNIVIGWAAGRRSMVSTGVIFASVCGGIGLIGGLIIVLWFIGTYNRLVRLRNETDRSWSNIDVLLKQRYDMIPNLVETVKGLADHESGIFEDITNARAAASNARAVGNIAELSQAEGSLTGFLGKLFALSEDTPELKANENFLSLQKEITDMEEQIADRRELYNATATNWNTSIEVIPANIVAGMINAERRDLFEVTEAAVRDAPKVSF